MMDYTRCPELRGTGGRPGDPEHFVASGPQRARQRNADGTGGAGDQYIPWELLVIERTSDR
jgi:hypothetical protein